MELTQEYLDKIYAVQEADPKAYAVLVAIAFDEEYVRNLHDGKLEPMEFIEALVKVCKACEKVHGYLDFNDVIYAYRCVLKTYAEALIADFNEKPIEMVTKLFESIASIIAYLKLNS